MEHKLQELQLGESQKSQWLRSSDVCELLGISNSTLQTMRLNGSIKGYKLGSTWFYKRQEINDSLEKGKVKGGKDAE